MILLILLFASEKNIMISIIKFHLFTHKSYAQSMMRSVVIAIYLLIAFLLYGDDVTSRKLVHMRQNEKITREITAKM